MTNPTPHQQQRASPPPDGAEFLQRIRGGDEAAFEALFRAFAPGLCAFVARYTGSAAVAEDLVQDLFLGLWRKRSELQIRDSVSAYLFSAARNRALNYLQHEKAAERFRAALLQRLDPSAASSEGELLDVLDLQECIAELPPRRRQIFLLSRQQGMTYREIAASLNLSIKTVETQMGRALEALRNRLLPPHS